MKLSILIPCYNEAGTIREVARRVYAAPLLQEWEREVIVIDDGSNEATKAALREVESAYPEIKVITRMHNGGKGAALKEGLRATSGDYLLVQDADLEYDPSDYSALLAPITGGNEVVFGSRQIAHNNAPGRFYYYWGGRLVNAIFNLAFSTHLSDLTTCYKVFPRTLIPALLAQPSDDFVFDAIELSSVLTKQKVIEVPIHYQARTAAEGKKLKAQDGVRCLLRILTLRFSTSARAIRFLVSGGSAALVNIFVLYALTEWAGLWYLASEVVAFILALCYNFALQKLWTFGSRSPQARPAHHQFSFFFLVNVANLALNTALLYALVEYAGLWYILAQLLTSLLIAFESFFLYRSIFR